MSPSTLSSFRRLDGTASGSGGKNTVQLYVLFLNASPALRHIQSRFSREIEAAEANATRLITLDGPEYVFEAVDGGTLLDDKQRSELLSSFAAPKTINLRADAPVILLKDLGSELRSGAIGKVKRFALATELCLPNPVSLTCSTLVKNGGIYPIVEFTLPDLSVREVEIWPCEWKLVLPCREVILARTQVRFSKCLQTFNKCVPLDPLGSFVGSFNS